MVKLILGPKGSGKTKTLVELVTKALTEEQGDVVCIEKDKALTYDLPHAARLINASEHGINSAELLRGFLSGLHAGNYDITYVFIDNFYKILSDTSDEAVAELLGWLEKFSDRSGIKVTIFGTADPETVSESIKKYF
ncbi:MAG: ATP-binding protein [Oscillospiraceae bacterium]|nr:ATP-binding protein [Oscillospiraceae bacterium]